MRLCIVLASVAWRVLTVMTNMDIFILKLRVDFGRKIDEDGL